MYVILRPKPTESQIVLYQIYNTNEILMEWQFEKRETVQQSFKMKFYN